MIPVAKFILFLLIVLAFSAVVIVVCVGVGIWMGGPIGAPIGYLAALIIAGLSGWFAAASGLLERLLW